MPPLEFAPLFERIRWGGRRLETVLGKAIGPGDDYAESWELADHEEDQTRVVGGPFDGWTLARLVRERGAALLGTAHRAVAPARVAPARERFPLLIKFLDATDRLSVQVHPNDEQARTYDPRENGKTEAWVILAAEPNSRLYAGLKPGVDRAALAAALADGRIEECLHSFPASVGECVFVPAGTVHAIGEGVLLAEVQQSSDITFRLHDWGRVGADGRPRELHVEEALACVDFARGPVSPVVPAQLGDGAPLSEELVRCPYFVIRRHTLTGSLAIPADHRFRILMVLRGEVELECGAEHRRLGLGRTLLLPAERDETRIRCERTEPAVLLDVVLP